MQWVCMHTVTDREQQPVDMHTYKQFHTAPIKLLAWQVQGQVGAWDIVMTSAASFGSHQRRSSITPANLYGTYPG